MMRIYIYIQKMLFETYYSGGKSGYKRAYIGKISLIYGNVCLIKEMCRRIFTKLRVRVGLLSHGGIENDSPRANTGRV